ncbi:MAG TPA: sialate O-acetylesterase, partial [Chthoniobacterales bacterium]
MIISAGLHPNQVLQRNELGVAVIVASGTTAAEGPVFAMVDGLSGFKNKRQVGSAGEGRFSFIFAGLPIGGPYRIIISCGTARQAIDGVHVGDVWLLAGQSNMQGYGDLASGLRSAPRVFARSMAGVWGAAEEPLHLLEESPDPVHTAQPLTPAEIVELRRSAKLGAGPGLSFAAEMFRRTLLPQGLIPCAHGGTSLADWDPSRKRLGGRSLYGSLFQAWQSTGQPIAGVLWYQGENDANEEHHATYAKRFARFVRALRRDLHQPNLPVLTVQLGRVVGSGAGAARYWNSVQEQQRNVPQLLKNVGVVAAVDLPLSDNIHLSGDAQQRLGIRLAR